VSDEDDARDRAAILARRRRWIALALAGAAAAATSGCPHACLSPTDVGYEPRDVGTDGGDGGVDD
jgi:hypothetical protein